MRIVVDFDNERMFPIALFLHPFCTFFALFFAHLLLTILGQNQILIRSSLARVSAFMFSVTCV